MRGKRISVIKLDEDHRIYLYQKKVLYKERRNGRLVTRFSGVSIVDLLGSSVISDEVKKKLAKLLEKSNSFLNRG